MNKVIVFFAVLQIFLLSCDSLDKNRNGNRLIGKIFSNTGSSNPFAKDGNASFFPAPDLDKSDSAFRHNADYHKDYPVFWVFVGRFASYEEMAGSPFYALMCHRIPELRHISQFTIDTTTQTEDVWMVIPAHEGVECEIREMNDTVRANPKHLNQARIYYRSRGGMKPLLIHTSMKRPGNIVMSLRTGNHQSSDGGAGKAVCVVPQYYNRYNHLACVPFHSDGDVFFPAPTSLLAHMVSDKWWADEDGRFALRFWANNQIAYRDGSEGLMWCSCFVYQHNGDVIYAVWSDDGQCRALWQMVDIADGKATVRQLKGNILPQSQEYALHQIE